MNRHAYGTCRDDTCPACAHIYDRQREDDPRDEGWTEADMGRMADGAAADMVFGREWS